MSQAISHNLTELLRQREECFVTVWECEQKLKEILPEFPLPPPPDLPSRRKRQAPKAKQIIPEQETPITKACVKLRELQKPSENAYHLIFEYNGERQDSFQTDTSLANAMANMKTDDFKLIAVETVNFISQDNWNKLEEIWKAEQ